MEIALSAGPLFRKTCGAVEGSIGCIWELEFGKQAALRNLAETLNGKQVLVRVEMRARVIDLSAGGWNCSCRASISVISVRRIRGIRLELAVQHREGECGRRREVEMVRWFRLKRTSPIAEAVRLMLLLIIPRPC